MKLYRTRIPDIAKKVIEELVKDGVRWIKCDLCGKVIKYHSNTSAMRTHLISCHKNAYDQMMEADSKRKRESLEAQGVQSGDVARTESVFSQASTQGAVA